MITKRPAAGGTLVTGRGGDERWRASFRLTKPGLLAADLRGPTAPGIMGKLAHVAIRIVDRGELSVPR